MSREGAQTGPLFSQTTIFHSAKHHAIVMTQ